MQPKLTVIVPVYKVELYLRRCLDSLVNQTMKNIEIICIDDGSPDDCGAICDEYAKIERGGVTFRVVHKKNEGVVGARNDGINLANGDYLTFIDADDWVDLDFYERMFASLGSWDADVFCSGGRYLETNESSKIVKTLDEPFFYQNGEHRAEMMARTLVTWRSRKNNEPLCDLGYVWDKIYKTSFIKEKILGWNNHSNYGSWEDALFQLHVFSKANLVGGCLEIGNHYRLNVTGSATTRFWKDLPESCKNWAEDAYEILEKEPAFKENVLQEAFIARCQMMLLHVVPYFMHHKNRDSYCIRARKYREFKDSYHFKEALRHKTPYIIGKSYLKIEIMRYTGLWSQYVIKWGKYVLRH